MFACSPSAQRPIPHVLPKAGTQKAPDEGRKTKSSATKNGKKQAAK
jgi:hypothetical protein